MLHWRVGLNPNHMVKGSGTWTAEEDEGLSKLVEVVGMKVRYCSLVCLFTCDLACVIETVGVSRCF